MVNIHLEESEKFMNKDIEIRYRDKHSHGIMIVEKEFVIRKWKKFRKLFKGYELYMCEHDSTYTYIITHEYHSIEEFVERNINK